MTHLKSKMGQEGYVKKHLKKLNKEDTYKVYRTVEKLCGKKKK
jgi:hypothetical protein